MAMAMAMAMETALVKVPALVKAPVTACHPPIQDLSTMSASLRESSQSPHTPYALAAPDSFFPDK
jgi:hypothetical protein